MKIREPRTKCSRSRLADQFLAVVHTWFSPSCVLRIFAPVEGVIAGMQRAVEAADAQLSFAGLYGVAEIRGQALLAKLSHDSARLGRIGL